ncbi:penicillin-binding protein [Niallia nealsonii]|uniref:Penicillin-binding protein n=2 Tax=Niallia nealsonii TaxID=115979 RepID=A0A2N0YX75_9BACI|nr:penicillin-binding protein [Niallia nealsonii]
MFCLFICMIIAVAKEKKQLVSFHAYLEKKISMSNLQLEETSYIKDKNNQIISEIQTSIHRKSLTEEKIPNFIKQVFILSEDQHFYEHKGFDVPSMGRALFANIESQSIEQGASTITQQLARNYLKSYNKTYNRKLQELFYAYELERKRTKEEILTDYVNAIYFANGMYGLEAAAEFYFDDSVAKLTKAQLIFLASIPNNPTVYNPIHHFKQTKKRQERLIDLLAANNIISKKESIQLKKEKLSLTLKTETDLYPDYTTYVEEELKQLIAENYGYTKKLQNASDKEKEIIEKQLQQEVADLYKKGITIQTALLPSIQQKAVAALNKTLAPYETEGAAVVIDQHTHQILALVAGKNYKKHDFNRSYQAYRQPGSAIKPLLVYAPYLEETKKGIYSQVNAGAYCSGSYCPKNYSGKNYGMVTIENAFIHSYNTPAVRILDTIGIEKAFTYLQPFQFQHVSENDYHLSAAVGGFSSGITPLELTDAYTTFGNDGTYKKARAILSVKDANGKEIMKWKDKSISVWSEQTNEKMRQLLKHTVTSGTAKKAYFPSTYLGGKTGTTNNYKDYWIVGLSNTQTVGVWVGRDQPSSLEAIESQSPHLHIWKQIMKR